MNQIEERAKSRGRFTERLVATLAFTAVMLWAAVVVVVKADVDGVVALAVSFVLSGGLVAVYDAWRELRSARREETDVELPDEDLVRL
ncbi:hypothetical protein ACIGNX_20870 [Actinosynnema sp. NPDC053489]|uniref:hypothetical protein n=1 Tax=Actinosynnema sp. NPDC053489 TaxID=3363916 RepID=UPI0037C9C840